jgi:hypothetical protein
MDIVTCLSAWVCVFEVEFLRQPNKDARSNRSKRRLQGIIIRKKPCMDPEKAALSVTGGTLQTSYHLQECVFGPVILLSLSPSLGSPLGWVTPRRCLESESVRLAKPLRDSVLRRSDGDPPENSG